MTESCEPSIEHVTLNRDPFGNTDFVRYAIRPDGKCGYHAIAVWLQKNRSGGYEATASVEQGSNPMLSYLLEYIKYTAGHRDYVKTKCRLTDKGIDSAIERVKNGDYMQTEELSILCCAFELTAFVYDPSYPVELRWTEVNPTEKDRDKIWLYNIKDPYEHFDLLEPLGKREEDTRKKRQSMRPRRARSQPKKRQERQQGRQQGKKPGESPCEGCAVQLQSTPNSLKF